MARAYKCDRCGDLFECNWKDITAIEIPDKEDDIVKYYIAKYNHNLELCPACKIGFKLWFLEADTKNREKVMDEKPLTDGYDIRPCLKSEVDE